MEETQPGEHQDIIQKRPKTYNLDHIAITAKDIRGSIEWHCDKLSCTCLFEDDTWALLQMPNGTKIALVTASQHPPHVGLRSSEAPFGETKLHRDGSQSFYEKDPNSDAVYEWIWYP